MRIRSLTIQSKKKFDQKVVLVTGASSGIGRQVSLDFASQGAESIILVARSQSKLDELGKTIRERYSIVTTVYSCDISDKNEVKTMGAEILNRFGHVDILVNNAGFGLYGKIQNQSIDEIESIMSTNYLGTVYCTKVFLDSMIKRKSGHIINIASVAASFGVAGLSAYCASKYAVLGFSESLSYELYGTGVQLTVVSPIGVKTGFFNNKTFGSRIPNYTGFMLKPKTVSNAILCATNSSRFEIVIPFYMRAAIWLKHTFPFVVKPLIGCHFRRELEKSYGVKEASD
ncbi:MAG: SDR family oxidoreductase [Thermoproteota archaeon]|nr:SDR family oxidoreductase [Thermoproteota archaeon]